VRALKKPSTAISLITSLLGVPLSDLPEKVAEKKTPKPHPLKKAPPARMQARAELPDDPAMPTLREIRAWCAAGATRMPGIGEGAVEFLMRGYSKGSRATLEARVGQRRLAVKIYAEDPSPEAALYEALAAAGLAGDSGVRVAPLLAWERDLRMLVFGWLEGPTAYQLVEGGQGERAGELAARWLQRVASLAVTLGPPFGAVRILDKARKWVAKLGALDPALGTAAAALAGTLKRTQPKEGAPRLVHGTLYARHVIDLGDGPGVIDWQRFGQGPPELDAGVFLATIWRLGQHDKTLAGAAARAERAFLAGTQDLVDERALAWHRAAALLHFAERVSKPIPRRPGDWPARSHAMLSEGARLAATAG
jgi:hypothetical protein